MADGLDKAQVVVGEVEVRLARPLPKYHCLGFRQFAGRGLRHVAV